MGKFEDFLERVDESFESGIEKFDKNIEDYFGDITPKTKISQKRETPVKSENTVENTGVNINPEDTAISIEPEDTVINIKPEDTVISIEQEDEER